MRPAGIKRTDRSTRRRSVVLGGQYGGSAASAAIVSLNGNRPTVSRSGARSWTLAIRRSAAARRNGRRAGRPAALNRLQTRLVMNAVLPDPLSPVTASRTLRSWTSPVSPGSRSNRSGRNAVGRRLSGRLHRDVEHDVGQDLADDAAQGRLVRAGSGGDHPARPTAQYSGGGAAVAAGADRRKRVGRFDPLQDPLQLLQPLGSLDVIDRRFRGLGLLLLLDRSVDRLDRPI